MTELWHFSEDPAIEVFAPHRRELHAIGEELVWAVGVAGSLYPLWDEIIATTLDFSGIRLRNAARAT